MGISTLSVGAAVGPTILETWATHYLNRKPRRKKPTAHISYDTGLSLIRRFLVYATNQTVEDVQAFTAQSAPGPLWARSEETDIPSSYVLNAAKYMNTALGESGIQAVGGRTWWQWREDGVPLKAEWIERKKDYEYRKQNKLDCKRCMFYVHGGAYYFGSVEAERYQMQRHARKLQARVFAPRYRLAPQFPFPCGLHDCLAAYLYLLAIQPPETIVVAGDSAGGGMVLSMLIILRDLGLPLPAGSVLISPWVDLTHSFPSVSGPGDFDYIPSSGFHHKPSVSWPPPSSDDLEILENVVVKDANGNDTTAKLLRAQSAARKGKQRASQDANGFIVQENPEGMPSPQQQHIDATPGPGHNLSVIIDGKTVVIKDQIQMYTANSTIAHPLVSPIMQASLGGLPPMCILAGGGELLRDEQIYIAHKAAHPSEYRAPGLSDDEWNEAKDRYPPTPVQLQVWEDLCHVAPTLAFTRPAKYMFRSVAQFSAWALARSQRSEIRILDDDTVSVISSASSDSSTSSEERRKSTQEKRSTTNGWSNKNPVKNFSRKGTAASMTVGHAGEPLPRFDNFMIRQRVTRHGEIYAMDPPSAIAACNIPIEEIGVIKPGPVKKWLKAQEQTGQKFTDIKRKLQARRMKELAESAGTHTGVFILHAEEFGVSRDEIENETPPPSAWAGRSKEDIPKRKAHKRNGRSLAIWSGWGSKHDEEAIDNEEDRIRRKLDVTMSITKVRPRTSMFGLNQIAGIPPKSSGTSDENQVASASALNNAPQNVSTSTKRLSVPAEAAETGESSSAVEQSSIPANALPPNTPPDVTNVETTPAASAIGSTGASPTSLRPGTASSDKSLSRVATPDLTNAEIHTATIASRSISRPVIAGHAVPFKVRRPSTEVQNASTVTLSGEPAIVSKSGEPNGINGLSPTEDRPMSSKEAARASSQYGGVDATVSSYNSNRASRISNAEGVHGEGSNSKGTASSNTVLPTKSYENSSRASNSLAPAPVAENNTKANTNQDASGSGISRAASDAGTWANRVIRDLSGGMIGASADTATPEPVKEEETPLASPAVQDGEILNAKDAAKRPEPTRFVTPSEVPYGS